MREQFLVFTNCCRVLSHVLRRELLHEGPPKVGDADIVAVFFGLAPFKAKRAKWHRQLVNELFIHP